MADGCTKFSQWFDWRASIRLKVLSTYWKLEIIEQNVGEKLHFLKHLVCNMKSLRSMASSIIATIIFTNFLNIFLRSKLSQDFMHFFIDDRWWLNSFIIYRLSKITILNFSNYKLFKWKLLTNQEFTHVFNWNEIQIQHFIDILEKFMPLSHIKINDLVTYWRLLCRKIVP